MLRGLVNPAFADHMLRALEQAGDFKGHPALNGVEPFRSFMFSQRMSSNAAKLVNRKRLKGVDVPMRWRQVRVPLIFPFHSPRFSILPVAPQLLRTRISQ